MTILDYLLTHASGIGLWSIVGLIVFAFIGSRLAEAYEGFAKVLGPLGTYWRRRADERKKRDRADLKVLAREVVSEIRPADYEQLQNDLALMQKQLERMMRRVADMQMTEDVNQAYLIHDTEFHFILDQMLAERGIKPPKRIPYREFAVKYRQGWRLGDNGWLKPQNDEIVQA